MNIMQHQHWTYGYNTTSPGAIYNATSTGDIWIYYMQQQHGTYGYNVTSTGDILIYCNINTGRMDINTGHMDIMQHQQGTYGFNTDRYILDLLRRVNHEGIWIYQGETKCIPTRSKTSDLLFNTHSIIKD